MTGVYDFGTGLAAMTLSAGAMTAVIAWRTRQAESVLPDVAGWLIIAGLIVLGVVLPSTG